MVTATMNKQRIILETIEEYDDPSNRALYYSKGTHLDATCLYESSNGNRCAVGRCMTNRALERYAYSSRGFEHLTEGLMYDDLLREEYRGQTLQFWVDLQMLHDTHSHWSDTGITDKGIKFVQDKFGLIIE